MKIPLPPGLVVAIGLLILPAPSSLAEASSPPGTPPLRPAGPPPIPDTPPPPTLPAPPPIVVPAKPAATAQAKPSPPFPAPPPQPEMVLPQRRPTESASFVRGIPNLRDLAMAVPEVEVWRAQSDSPQIPARRHRRFALVYVVGKEPALLRLRFHPLAAGQGVIVQPGPGVTVNSPGTEFRVDKNGECIVSVSLDGSFSRSDINVYCAGVKSKVPLERTSLETVQAREAAGRSER